MMLRMLLEKCPGLGMLLALDLVVKMRLLRRTEEALMLQMKCNIRVRRSLQFSS
jgi:hypothetical protein